ncbi:MAG: ornithine carbamoyltransferase [Phycisphaera sp.]|nr:ornithine carbamoyltransferase [Phycisphaera sp.]
MARTPDISALEGLRGRSILRLVDLSADEIRAILSLARMVKADYGAFRGALSQRALVMLFEKPSLRTRLSFELGFQKLGGCVSFLDHRNERIGARESTADYGRNLERVADVIVARVFAHDTLVSLRKSCSAPIVNALSEIAHPCQALADAQTLVEHGIALESCHLAWMGDGNNVCLSLMELTAIMGGRMTVVTPAAHKPCPTLSAEIAAVAAKTGATIVLTSDPAAIKGAHAVYTDAWISMGQQDSAEKIASLRALSVTPEIMKIAGPQAKFMHCLPAHRGEEVVDPVIDGPQSVVFDQAENRMHAQNALLLALLGAVPASHGVRADAAQLLSQTR